MQKLDIRIWNAQLRTLRVHFSNWRNVIIDQRLQMGQARAIADWRLLMRTWATWNGKYKYDLELISEMRLLVWRLENRDA